MSNWSSPGIIYCRFTDQTFVTKMKRNFNVPKGSRLNRIKFKFQMETNSNLLNIYYARYKWRIRLFGWGVRYVLIPWRKIALSLSIFVTWQNKYKTNKFLCNIILVHRCIFVINTKETIARQVSQAPPSYALINCVYKLSFRQKFLSNAEDKILQNERLYSHHSPGVHLSPKIHR